MSKRNSKTSPTTPAKVGEALVNDNSLAEVKKFSRWDTVEVELHDLNDGKSQLYIIADGEPLALWTDAYQNLEIKKTHARDVKNRLEKSNLIIKVSISELKQFYPRVHLACTAKYISNYYYFLSDGGYNRAILEVKTSGMKDREVAARIERRKDEMASVFTKFKRGELVQVDAPPVIQKIKEKRDEGTSLNKQIGRCVKDWLMPDYARHGKNPHSAFSDEHRAINTIVNGEHEADLKNKLNSDGLDIHNYTKISEIALIEAGIVDNETRWNISKRVVDNLYPMRHEKSLKLNDREIALVKRGCSENQRSLFNFNSRKQIQGSS